MERTEIYQRLETAKVALKTSHADAATIQTVVKAVTANQYEENAWRIFREVMNSTKDIAPIDAAEVIGKVRQAKTISTLRMHARSVRHLSMQILQTYLKMADDAQRNRNWAAVERIVSMPQFTALTTLSSLLPNDYRNPILPNFTEAWKVSKKRKSKKTSLRGLPNHWREEVVEHSFGQFRLPVLICMLTGCRPQEIKNGVIIKRVGHDLYVRIQGAKFIEGKAGQEVRMLKLPDHPLKEILSNIMHECDETENKLYIKVDKPNSITTHIRKLARELWPNHKESITAYTARHAMAADCKAAVATNQTLDQDFVSKTLGHSVDKTASYYGTSSQSSDTGIVPANVVVTTAVKHKVRERNQERLNSGKMLRNIKASEKLII